MNDELVIEIKTKNELKQAYLQFVKHGGIFIPTLKEFAFKDEVTVKLILLNEPNPLIFTGKIIWLTPKNAAHGVQPGIGVQFTDKNTEDLKNKIESYLV